MLQGLRPTTLRICPGIGFAFSRHGALPAFLPDSKTAGQNHVGTSGGILTEKEGFLWRHPTGNDNTFPRAQVALGDTHVCEAALRNRHWRSRASRLRGITKCNLVTRNDRDHRGAGSSSSSRPSCSTARERIMPRASLSAASITSETNERTSFEISGFHMLSLVSSFSAMSSTEVSLCPAHTRSSQCRCQFLGSARVSRVGDGASPSRTFLNVGATERLFRRDAETNTRDACATQNAAFASRMLLTRDWPRTHCCHGFNGCSDSRGGRRVHRAESGDRLHYAGRERPGSRGQSARGY